MSTSRLLEGMNHTVATAKLTTAAMTVGRRIDHHTNANAIRRFFESVNRLVDTPYVGLHLQLHSGIYFLFLLRTFQLSISNLTHESIQQESNHYAYWADTLVMGFALFHHLIASRFKMELNNRNELASFLFLSTATLAPHLTSQYYPFSSFCVFGSIYSLRAATAELPNHQNEKEASNSNSEANGYKTLPSRHWL